MDSLDTEHVNPNPKREDLWVFHLRKARTIAGEPYVGLCLLKLEPQRVLMKMIFNQVVMHDYLNLDKPCVVLRFPKGEPWLTVTLRGQENGTALLQITSHPKVRQEKMQ
jgi:hypothetical protein